MRHTEDELEKARQEIAVLQQRLDELQAQTETEFVRYRNFIKTSRDGIILYDMEGNVIESNDRQLEMLGYTLDELKRLHAEDWDINYSPEGVEELNEIIRHRPIEFETLHRRKDGSVYNASVSAGTLEAGGKYFIYSSTRDITAQKQAEKALREREAQFRSVFENTAVGIIVADVETKRITLANQTICDMLDYPHEKLVTMKMLDIHPAEDVGWILNNFVEQVHSNLTLTKNIPMLRSDGSRFLADIGTSLMEIDGKAHLVGMFQDVTERHANELELERYREQLEELVEERTSTLMRAESLSHTGSWRYDFKEESLVWSQEVHRIFGVSNTETVTMDFFVSKIHPDDVENVMGHWNRALEGDPYTVEHRIVTPEGVKWVNEIAEISFDEHHVPLVAHGAVQDITSLVESNRQLIVAKEAAEEAAKVKSEFLANMSHEIRTPMNAVIGMTALALDTALDDKQRNYVQKANIAAENLLGIINDILDFSKLEAGRLQLSPVHFKLSDVFSQTLHLINTAAKSKDMRIKVMMGPEVPRYLFADSLRLGQVLTNLTSNAVKFSHQGGSIILSASLKEESDMDAVIQFSIADEGIGVSLEKQEKLFKAFSQAESSTTRRFGGTGLGLTISKSIVELMGGEIWLESEEGVGSTFSFTTRMRKSDENAVMESTQDSKKRTRMAVQRLKGAHILLAEDNEMNQELAAELLRMHGLKVTIANNGQEVLDILKRERFDGILMDCQMPVMDGYMATRKIREQEQYKSLPILAMTANVMEGDRQKTLMAGMDDYIAKPIDAAEMFLTMVKWIKPTTG